LGGKQFGKSTEIYKFEKIKRAKAEATAKYPDIPIIDMGVGEPDIPADPGVVARLSEEARYQSLSVARTLPASGIEG